MLLRTKRLVLRPLREEDAADLVSITAVPEYRPEFLWHAHTPESAAQFIRLAMSSEKVEDHEVCSFAIALVTDPTLIGIIQLTIRPYHQKGGLGFELHPKFWGQGLMAETVRRVLEFGFFEKSLERISGGADLENTRSWRAMEKAGMRREGVLRHDRQFDGVWRDTVLYAALRDEVAAG